MGSQIFGILGVRNTLVSRDLKSGRFVVKKGTNELGSQKLHLLNSDQEGSVFGHRIDYNEVGVDPGTPSSLPLPPLPRCHAQYKLNVEDDN